MTIIVVVLFVADELAVGEKGRWYVEVAVSTKTVLRLHTCRGCQGLHLHLAVGNALHAQLVLEDACLQPSELKLAVRSLLLGIR